MSVEVRTLELVTDSTKSISDLKSFEEAIGSLSSKLLAFNTAKEKAFKDLASDWTRLGKQLKPIRLEVSFAGLSAKFRQFQRHLLSHLAETQAMVDRHKIVLRTTTSIAGAAGVGAAAQVSAATATKQMTDQALFTGVMGKKFAEQDLRRLQSNKTMPRMTADMDTLLRDHWNMTKKQIEGFYGKYNQLQTNDQKRIEQMLRQTFSPAMATGRAQRQANWVTELAKQEGWHMQIIRPFLQEIQQKHAFVKEDPTPERLRQIARDYYASQGGKVGQRQINLDDLAQSAGAAWYKDPKLMGAQRNVLDQISSGQYKRSQIIASRSHLRGGQYVDLLAQADKNILRRDFSDLRSSLSIDQPAAPFTKENLTQGKVLRHSEENLKAFINKQLGIYEDNRGKLLAQIKKDLEILDTKQYFDIDDATYEREKKKLTDRAKQLQKDQYSSKRAASVTHAQRQSDLEYAFRNMPFQEVGAYNQDVSKKLVDELYGTKAKRLESLQSKIEGSERTDIGKRAEFLQKEIDLIDHKRFLIEKATAALTKENQVASKSAILSKAHEIETNLLKQNNLYEKRGKLLEHLQLIEKRAAQYADVDTIKKSQDLQKRLDTTRKTVIDPSDTKQVNKFANEIDRASKETDKLQKSFDRAHRSGGIMNSVLGKTGMALTAIAASIFILQNVYMWIQAALAPTMEFEGALRKLDQQNNVLKEDYGALKTIINDAFTSGAMSVEAATGKFQEMRDAGYTTQEALVSVQREMARLNDINLDYAVGQFDRLAGAIKNLLNVKGNWLGNLVGAAADKALYMGANEQQQQEYDKFEQLIERGKYELAKRQGQYSYAKDFLGKNEETLNKLQKNIQDQELYLRQLKETQKMFINPTAQPIDSWRSQSAQELAKTGYSGGMPMTRTERNNATVQAEKDLQYQEEQRIKEYEKKLNDRQKKINQILQNVQQNAAILENRKQQSDYAYKIELNDIQAKDGDTVRGFLSSGKEITIRLEGINTPESVHQDQSRNTALGKEASQFFNELLAKQEKIFVATDFQTGKYGRTLGELYGIDSSGKKTNLNQEMIKHGYATYYDRYGKHPYRHEEYQQTYNSLSQEQKNALLGTQQGYQSQTVAPKTIVEEFQSDIAVNLGGVQSPEEARQIAQSVQKLMSDQEKRQRAISRAENRALAEREKAEREHMEAFRQALKVAESKWDFSSASPEAFFKDTLGQRGLTVDTEEKQRLFQSAVDKFNNKIVSWQNAFGKIAADDTLSKELNKIAALERKAVVEHLDLAQAYENLTGSAKPLKEVFEKLRHEAYKAAVERDFDWAFKETHGVSFKENQESIDKYEVYRQSFLDLGPTGEKVRNKLEVVKINKLIQELEGNAPGFLDKPDPIFQGKTSREFLEFMKGRVGKDAREYTAYETALMTNTDFGTVTMTEKEKAIYETQGHFTEMAGAALADYANEAEKTATKTYQAFQKAFTGMEDALVNFVMTGKLEWKSLAQSIIADIVRIQVQSAITGPLAQGLAPKSSGGGGWLSTAFNFVKGLFSAQGNMFNRYGLIPFATGGIVTKPTMFAFGQGGIGVMGEAGPEAIMPVTRTPSGDLGVKAVGGSGMTVNIYEAPGTKARVEQSSDGMNMNVIIEQIENAIARRMSRDGGLSRFMDARYQKNR